MEIRCRCPACRAKLDIAEKHAGKTIGCPRCRGPVEVPPLGAPGWHVPEAPQSPADVPVEPQPPIAAQPPSTAQPPPIVVHSPEAIAQPPAIPAQPPQGVTAQPPLAPVLPATAGSAAGPPIVGSIGPPAAPSAAPAELQAAFGAVETGHANVARRAGRRSQPTSVWPMLIAGAVLLLAGGILLGLFLSQGGAIGAGDGADRGDAPAGGSGVLVLSWPEEERTSAALAIDGRQSGIAGANVLRYDLPAGPHDVRIERRGFEPFVKRVVLRSGATEHVRPTWKRRAGGDSETELAPAAVLTDTGRQVRGFEGWLTSFDAARRQAASAKQEIVIVFGADGQRTTQELAAALAEPSAKQALGQRVRTMVDLSGRSVDRDQAIENRQLMGEFGLTRLPALALTDDQGRPYAIEKRWERGFERMADRLDEWQKQRIDRDRLLAAAEKGSEADQLGAASVTVKWLQENGVWTFYRPEIRKWSELAQRLDPQNEQHLLEAFFEPQWMLRVQETNPNDSADALRVAEELQPWSERKFGDADRGARVHLAAMQLLTDARKFDEATRQMELAVKYRPKDARLAESIRHVQQHLDNKDVISSGSGFLVTRGGYVLTNRHVVDSPGKIVIRVPGTKDTIPADVVAQDAERDLALLKVALPKAGLFQPLALRVANLRRGSAVALFGYPLGDSLGSNLKFTAGTISALPEDSNNQMYLLDATVNPGSSGGPLCDQRGNVVGLVTAKTGGSTLEDSYGLAIPASVIATFLDQHLPVEASRPLADSNESPLNWDLVDERVSGGVLMVVKKRP